MKILVTGASGFVGSYVTERLLKDGNEVNILDHHIYNKNLSDDILENCNIFEGDIRDEDIISKAIRDCEIVYHFASLVGVDAYSKYKVLTMEIEESGLKNICQHAIENRCQKLIYPSSSAVYGRQVVESALNEEILSAPISNYAIAKRYNEIYLESLYEEQKLNSVCLRIFNVYGPRQDERLAIPKFIEKALNNEPIEIFGDGRQTRDFVYIDDVVTAAIYAAKKINGYEIINVASGTENSIQSVAKSVIENIQSTSYVHYKTLPKNRSSFEVNKCIGDITKLKRLTGFVPQIAIEFGIKETCKYIKEKNCK